MIVCLDVGNTHIYGGVFVENKIQLRFRFPSSAPCTSDIFGLFLKNVLKENGLDPLKVRAVSMCSVVPTLDYSLVAACKKYLSVTPLELKPGTKTGIKLDVKNPLELGSDRIANAVAAVHHFPKKNLIIADFGTATTVCVISKDQVYLGGAILPGFKLSMQALSQSAAKLLQVDLVIPKSVIGKTTETNLQAGIYYAQIGAMKEIIGKINQSIFKDDPAMLISTGGYSHLLENENFFSVNKPDLVLEGLQLVLEKNS